jgi:hypothetical protein
VLGESKPLVLGESKPLVLGESKPLQSGQILEKYKFYSITV